MKAQKLKSFSDFLKRAEIIPHALLVITDNQSENYEEAVAELRALNYDIPVYELNLSDHPQNREEVKTLRPQDGLPAFIYFRGKKIVSKIIYFDKKHDLSHFITSAISNFSELDR